MINIHRSSRQVHVYICKYNIRVYSLTLQSSLFLIRKFNNIRFK